MDGPLYIYGLMRGRPAALSDEVADLKTPDGASAPSLYHAGPVTLLASPHDASEVLQRRRNMLAHTRILEAAMAHTTILPMRFGIVADSLAAFTQTIEGKEEALAEQFQALEGCVELGLRISWPREAAMAAMAEAEPGLKEQHAKLAARGPEAHYARIDFGRQIAEMLDRRRKSEERALISALRPLVKSHILRAAEADVEVLRAEFLVAADAQTAFLEATETAVAASTFGGDTPAEIRCVGPAPAYNFVSLSLATPDRPEPAKSVA